MTAATYCAFVTKHLPWPWMRQTEDGLGGMPHTCFLLNESPPYAQWVVVVDEPPDGFMTHVPVPRRVLFITEPPEVKVYPAQYLRQFGNIISPYAIRGIAGECLLLENPCLTWHLGVATAKNAYTSTIKNLGEIRDLPVAEKSRLLSVICSTKTFTQAQRKRIAFVEKLQSRFGMSVDVYGRGRNPVSDKGQVILPYKYHLVLENSYLDNSWTEKLSDAWLGYAYPIYLGAANVADHCPSGALLVLQPDSDEANLDAIERLLSEDPWKCSVSAIQKCRQWVLETTNIFGRMDRLVHEASAQIRALPNLACAVPLRGTARWQRVLLRNAMRLGLYDPLSR